MSQTIILVPGYTNSDPEHWQRIIEKKYSNVVVVKQRDWNNPARQDWVDGIQRTINMVDGDIFLVGHSCGAIAITQWAQTQQCEKIVGAILVAPADVDSSDAPAPIQVQRPIPLGKLPFKSMVVYSDNDEYLKPNRACFFANNWGSQIFKITNGGHINTASGYGEWLQGEDLIKSVSGFALIPRINNYFVNI